MISPRYFAAFGMGFAGVWLLAGPGWALCAGAAVLAVPHGGGPSWARLAAWARRLRAVPRRTAAVTAVAAGVAAFAAGIGLAAGAGAGAAAGGAAAGLLGLHLGWNA